MNEFTPKKVRTATLAEFKQHGRKFSCLTSYDTLTSKIFDEAGIDVLLVGDSAGNTILGQQSTLEISIDEMISFGRAVAASVNRALVCVDMPFGSYEVSPAQATENAIRLMKHSGCEAIKLEGGAERAEAVSAIVAAGIPVMGHIGFTPQSVHALGGFRVQGRGDKAQQLIDQAVALEQAGVFAIVLEMVPADLAGKITKRLSIPTIGIGAGSKTDGQILVWQDFAGLTSEKRKFVKQYLNLKMDLHQAATKYREDVANGEFPGPEHSFED